MASVDIFRLSKSFGDLKVINDISVRIEHGEFAVFVGPSGCGKSTMLRLIAGLEELDDGTIHFGGARIDNLPPADRKIAMVFQSYALYPHMTVEQNMAFGLKMAKMPETEITRRVAKAASMLQISHLLKRMPKELSGGQRQRVAIGRAITRDPKVFLFDEPLSNLDAALRLDMRIEIARLKEQMRDTTMIYVTHDQVEAMTLADRIFVFNQGKVEQIGTPMQLYKEPTNRFVASFIGSPSMNFIDATVATNGNKVKLQAGGAVDLSVNDARKSLGLADVASMGIRPEHISIGDGSTPFARGKVRYIEALGDSSVILVEDDAGETISIKSAVQNTVERGALVDLYCNLSDIHLFDQAGKRVDWGISNEE